MARPATHRGPSVMNTAAARSRHPHGGLELPEDWLAWKPFGVAHKVGPSEITLGGGEVALSLPVSRQR